MAMRLLLALAVVAGLLALVGWWIFADSGHEPVSVDPGAASMREVDESPPAPVTVGDATPKPERDLEASRSAESGAEETDPDDPVDPERLATIVGRVVDPQGRALADVDVHIRRRNEITRTESSGRFQLQPTMAGGRMTDSYTVSFMRAGYGVHQVEVNARAGATTNLGDVELQIAGRLSGLVVDGLDRGLPEAQVIVEEFTQAFREARLHGPSTRLLETTTDEAGRFRLEDVPCGPIRVWAGAPGLAWSWSDVIEMEPLREIDDLRFQVVPLDPDETITLTVVDPDDQPIPYARVSFRYKSSGRSGSGGQNADGNGVLVKYLDVRAPHWFEASDPKGRYQPAVIDAVEPGTDDLILKLQPARPIDVTVRGPDGPVESYRLHIIGVDSGQRLSGHSETILDGITRIIVPPVAFDLQVQANGYELARVGPFEPDKVADEVEINLVPLPIIRGLVTRAGKVVPGARVGLHEVIDAGHRLVINGFPCRSRKNAEASATTDMDGEFELTLRRKGRYYLRAEAPGLAPGESGPFVVDPQLGADGLTVDLPVGGAIEGRLLVAPGADAAGRIIGVSRGDGYGFTARTDARGGFRLEDLMPGEWLLEPRDAEINTRHTRSSTVRVDEDQGIPYSCIVQDGRTTHFDIDVTQFQEATLNGALQFSGQSVAGWQAILESSSDPGRGWAAQVDSGGRFRVSLPTIGQYRLQLKGTVRGSTFATLNDVVTLQSGDNDWSLDLPVGSLDGETTAGEGKARSARLNWSDGRRSFWCQLEVDADGRFHVPLAPAGDCQLFYELQDGRSGEVMLRIQEGASNRIAVP